MNTSANLLSPFCTFLSGKYSFMNKILKIILFLVIYLRTISQLWGFTPSQSEFFSNDTSKNPPFVKLFGYNSIQDSIMDETVIYFQQGASDIYNPFYDVEKLMNSDTIVPNIFTILKDNKKLSVCGLPLFTDSETIVSIGYSVLTKGQNFINAGLINNFPPDVSVFLEDKITGNTQDLIKNPIYSFDIKPGDPVDRFAMHFYDLSVFVKNNIPVSNFFLWSSDKNIFINYSGKQALVAIYNLQGQEIMKREVINSGLHKYYLNSSKGLYLVKIISNDNASVKKVYIN
jgi:hypothetical protein